MRQLRRHHHRLVLEAATAGPEPDSAPDVGQDSVMCVACKVDTSCEHSLKDCAAIEGESFVFRRGGQKIEKYCAAGVYDPPGYSQGVRVTDGQTILFLAGQAAL